MEHTDNRLKGTASRRGVWMMILGLPLAVSATAASFEKEASSPDDASRAIRKVLDEQVVAWNKGDLEGFMAGYWNSPKLSFASGKDKTRGWQATFDRYKKRYQSEGREMG